MSIKNWATKTFYKHTKTFFSFHVFNFLLKNHTRLSIIQHFQNFQNTKSINLPLKNTEKQILLEKETQYIFVNFLDKPQWGGRT